MSIDWQSSIGKVRLRIGDVSDLPFLPDEVIQGAVDDVSGNLSEAARTCAQYILAQLAFKSHKKMVQLEIWGSEAFSNYRTFLIDTISNPALMSYSSVPYLITDSDEGTSPLKDFVDNWNNCYSRPNVNDTLDFQAHWSGHVNDGL